MHIGVLQNFYCQTVCMLSVLLTSVHGNMTTGSHKLLLCEYYRYQVTPSTIPPEAKVTAVTTSPAQHPRVRSLVTEVKPGRPLSGRSILPRRE